MWPEFGTRGLCAGVGGLRSSPTAVRLDRRAGRLPRRRTRRRKARPCPPSSLQQRVLTALAPGPARDRRRCCCCQRPICASVSQSWSLLGSLGVGRAGRNRHASWPHRLPCSDRNLPVAAVAASRSADWSAVPADLGRASLVAARITCLRLRVRRARDAISIPLLVLIGLPVLLGPWVAMVRAPLALREQGPLAGPVPAGARSGWRTRRLFRRAGSGGATKLAPVLSPGKTRVGVYGALAGAALLRPVARLGAWVSRGSRRCIVVLICVVDRLHLRRRRPVRELAQAPPGTSRTPGGCCPGTAASSTVSTA